MSATVSHALRWWARRRPAEPALAVGGVSLTYRELENWTSRVAESLAKSGVAPGDRVGVIGRNSLEWAVAALSVIKTGAILLPLNNRFRARELADIVADTTPTRILGDDEFADVVAGLPGGIGFGALSGLGRLRPGPDADFRRDRDPSEPLIIMMTSGSTGRPKGVVYTDAGILGAIFEWMLMEETVRPGVRIFLPVPFAFAPGTVWGLMRAVTLGGLLVFQPKFDPAEAVRLLQEYEIQISLGGPIIYEQMARTPDFEAAEFPHLKTAVTGGARVPVELLEKWMGKGLPIRQLYGMSEIGGIATATMAEDAFAHPDTCGSGGIFSEVKVIREDGTECERGEQGGIIARGPSVMLGYWNDPGRTAEVLKDGWIHGGDAGYFTEDGRLKFVDRVRDIIISGGINISPAEVESVIGAIDGVEEVVVIAAADEKYGEVPAAVLRLREGATAEDVLAVCREQLADFKVPRHVVVRAEPLPRLAHGKIDKVEVRREYAGLGTSGEPK
ncbi:class I adenylate-forming enzyme family protein [Actinocorallia aurantiaca]|uniref:Long-chain-fatty-acid--CoA ligase FadD13 n=1 Tax=Actinocorallia aurantiaca TaxID=46204 RepID=A0ABP6H471_9ACTN